MTSREEAVPVPMVPAEPEFDRIRPKITLFGLLVFFTMLGLLAALIGPFLRRQAQGQWSACAKGNLHNIAVALEMYSSDHGGLYPNELNQLVPKYLAQVPVCPESEVGYVYKTGRVGYNTDGHTDNYYLIYCEEGHPDVGCPVGYPKYDPELGLIER